MTGVPESLPARYDPDRQPNGQLIPGALIKSGRNTGGALTKVNQSKLNQLQDLVMTAITPNDIIEVLAGLKEFALTCPDNGVRLKAMIYFCDRCLGRPVEKVETKVENTTQVNLPMDLSPAELETMKNVLAKMDVPIDAEFEVKPAIEG